MAYLTRRERDAVVGLATVFLTGFLAGFFSYTNLAGQVVYDYTSSVGLLFIAFALYLVYRGLRRLAGYASSRGRSDSTV